MINQRARCYLQCNEQTIYVAKRYEICEFGYIDWPGVVVITEIYCLNASEMKSDQETLHVLRRAAILLLSLI